MKSKYCLIILLLLSTSSCTKSNIKNADVSQPNTNKSIDFLFNKIQQKNPEFQIEVWTEKKKYFIGEYVKFHLKSNRDCYVTLVEATTSGTVYVLFPNKYSQNNFIQANKTYNIPDENYDFDIKVNRPVGVEKIKLIASLKPISIFDLNFEKPFLKVDINSNAIAEKIKNLPEKLSNTKWTETVYEYQIVKNQGDKGLQEEEGLDAPVPIPIGGTYEIWDSTRK